MVLIKSMNYSGLTIYLKKYLYKNFNIQPQTEYNSI